MRFKFAALLAGAFLFLTVPAFAGPVNFCVGATSTITDVGHSVSAGGLTATGFTSAGVNADLACKNQGPSEFGLGIFGEADGEVDSGHFIQIAGLKGATLSVIGSVQSGETFDLFGSNSDGVLGTTSVITGSTCASDICNVSVDLGSFTFLDLTATNSGDVLLETVTSPTPEPSTYLLLGTGLLMLGFMMRRKFASTSC